MFKVWDINVQAFEAFVDLETQWRMLAVPSAAGTRVFRTGLDYSAVETVMHLRGVPAADFGLIRIMEAAALEAFAEAAGQ